MEYDANGNKTKEADKCGIASTHNYEKLNRLTGTTRDGQLPLKQEYDANGNVLLATDANNNTTAFNYDHRNLRTMESRLLAAICRFELDSMGEVAKATDPEGRETVSCRQYEQPHRRQRHGDHAHLRRPQPRDDQALLGQR